MASCHTHAAHQTIFPQKFLAEKSLPQIARMCTEVSGARYSPTDFTDVHRLGGYGIPAIPTQPLNYLPTEVSGREEPPTEFTDFTEVYDARYSPTDCTDVHRLGGYGIPAIPTQPPNYLPTEFRNHSGWRRTFSHRLHRLTQIRRRACQNSQYK